MRIWLPPDGIGKVTSTTEIFDGQWHFLCGTYNASTGTMEVYVDGELEDNTNYTPTPLPTTTGNIRLASDCVGHRYTMTIDDLRIYNRALSQEEINEIMNECQPDSDGDGIPDDEDSCPFEDATGFDVDGDGCIDSTSGLTTLVETLLDEGVIDEEMKTSLLSKIDNASKSASKENICAAVNQLGALINQVNAQRGNKISDEAADQVIAYTQSVINWYLDQLPEGETC